MSFNDESVDDLAHQDEMSQWMVFVQVNDEKHLGGVLELGLLLEILDLQFHRILRD